MSNQERMMNGLECQNTTPCHAQPDRLAAYQRTRQALLTNPTDSALWLQMSDLVQDPQQQRDCFERALALDPHNAAAQDGLEHLRVKALLVTISRSAQPAPAPEPQRLGEYLVAHRLITAAQLEDALAEQRQRKTQGERIQLGEILLNHSWISITALASALVRHCPQPASRMFQRLGDYLVAEGIITQTQLEAALVEQMQLKRQGKHVLLGEILLCNRAVTAACLEHILERQRSEFFGCFGD